MKLSAPIYILKKQAKELKTRQSVSMSEALNLIARREGYTAWSLLQAHNQSPLPQKYSQILDFLNPGDLVLLGARPSMGKTSFAVGLFVKAIQEIKAKHYLFTLDLHHKEIARRIAGCDQSIGMDNSRFELDYSDEISADYIINKAKQQISPGSLVVVDYLQLLDHRRSNPPIDEQIKELKNFAKNQGCIVLLLSQVHRALESRANQRPLLSDVKMINPFDMSLINKAIFLFKTKSVPNQVEVIFRRPQEHSLFARWNSADSVFSD